MKTYVCLTSEEVKVLVSGLSRSRVTARRDVADKIKKAVFPTYEDHGEFDLELIGPDEYELTGDEDE